MASTAQPVPPDVATQASAGRFSRLWAFRRLTIGAALLLALVLGSVFAPLLTDFPPNAIGAASAFSPPSLAHPFGTDLLGRDNFSRALYGGRLTFIVVAATVLLSSVIGVGLGLLAGYRVGWVDSLIMRLMDGVLAFPGLILALAIAFALGPSAATIVVALSVVQVPAFARLTRAQTVRLRNVEFVEASRAVGVRPSRLILRHVLPNMGDVLLIQLSIAAGATIFTQASLSFLGLGLPPPAPSWGGMLKDGYPYLQVAPWVSIIPGAMIFLAVLAFTFLGDGLRDLFDPRSRRLQFR